MSQPFVDYNLIFGQTLLAQTVHLDRGHEANREQPGQPILPESEIEEISEKPQRREQEVFHGAEQEDLEPETHLEEPPKSSKDYDKSEATNDQVEMNQVPQDQADE